MQALFDAIRARDLPALTHLLADQADANATQLGIPALLVAVHHGPIEVVRLLLDHGADPNAPANPLGQFKGPHSLHVSNDWLANALEEDPMGVIEGTTQPPVMKEWFYKGDAALLVAVDAKNTEVEKLLLERGADPTVLLRPR